MKEALKIISKKLGVVIVQDKNKITTGIITDGNVRKLRQKNIDFQKTIVKNVMTKNPININIDTLAIKALRYNVIKDYVDYFVFIKIQIRIKLQD